MKVQSSGHKSLMRLGASPGAVIALGRMNSEIDIRQVLPSIHVPTLVFIGSATKECL